MQQQTLGMPLASPPVVQPRRQGVPLATRPVRPCHFCGEMGHLRLYCPARAAAVNRKWYPFHVEGDTSCDVRYRERRCEGAGSVNKTDRSIWEKFPIVESADVESQSPQIVAVVRAIRNG